MGAYSPAPNIDAALSARVMAEIIEPTLRAMRAMGAPYRGVLYAGLMITRDGPKLIEYNARFGDPETQVLMLRLMSDLVPALLASRDGQLKSFDLRWYPDPALTVVMAAKGYPGNYARGSVIEGLEDAAKVEGVQIFHAGTKADGTKILANGGRVLNVSAIGKTVKQAQARAYEAISRIRWPEGFYRHDIGWRAIETRIALMADLADLYPGYASRWIETSAGKSLPAPEAADRRSCCCTAIRNRT